MHPYWAQKTKKSERKRKVEEKEKEGERRKQPKLHPKCPNRKSEQEIKAGE